MAEVAVGFVGENSVYPKEANKLTRQGNTESALVYANEKAIVAKKEMYQVRNGTGFVSDERTKSTFTSRWIYRVVFHGVKELKRTRFRDNS